MRSVIVLLGIMMCVLILGLGNADAVVVDIYSGHTAAGGGAPYTGLVGSFTSADVLFATNTGYAWHPFGLSDFGANITGFLQVISDGMYVFALNSDDGSLLFIDGGLAVNNGGAHGPLTVSNSVFLTAGLHAFNVQFFEDFGGPSGVDLYLPDGVTYASASVPEPSTFQLLGAAAIGLVLAVRRFRIR